MSTELRNSVDRFIKLRVRTEVGNTIPTSTLYAEFRKFASEHNCSDVKLSDLFSQHLSTKRVARGKVFVDCELIQNVPWIAPKCTEYKTVYVQCHSGMNIFYPKIFSMDSLIKNITLMNGDKRVLGCLMMNDKTPDIRAFWYGPLLQDIWFIADEQTALYVLVDDSCTVKITYIISLEKIEYESLDGSTVVPVSAQYIRSNGQQTLSYLYYDNDAILAFLPDKVDVGGRKGYIIPKMCQADCLLEYTAEFLVTEIKAIVQDSYVVKTDKGYCRTHVLRFEPFDIVSDIRIQTNPTQTVTLYSNTYSELDLTEYRYFNTERLGTLYLTVMTPCLCTDISSSTLFNITYNGIKIRDPQSLLKAPYQTKQLQTYLDGSMAAEAIVVPVFDRKFDELLKIQPKFKFGHNKESEHQCMRTDTYFGSSTIHLNPGEAINGIRLSYPTRIAKVTFTIGGATIMTWTPDTYDFSSTLTLQYFDGTGVSLPFMNYQTYAFEITPIQVIDPCRKELAFEVYIDETSYDGEAPDEAVILVQKFTETPTLYTALTGPPISYLHVQGSADTVVLFDGHKQHVLDHKDGMWSIQFDEPLDPKTCILHISPLSETCKIIQQGPGVLRLSGGFAGLITAD